MRPLPQFFLCLTLLLLGGSLRVGGAEYGATMPPPPMAKSVEVTVYLGEEASIPLRALGRSANEANFLLRSQPSLGRLSAIESQGRGQAAVRYQHDASRAGEWDEFTFAVQGPDSPVSAPAKVRIRIVDRPPQFFSTKELRFGGLVCGQSSEQTFTIENRGGGVVAGKVHAGGPWEVVGDGRYQLRKGEMASLTVRFSPTSAGSFSDHVFFSHDKEFLVHLSGQARAPFDVEESEIALLHPSSPEAASGQTLHLHNNLDHSLTLEFKLPPFLRGPARLELPAKSTVSVQITANPSAVRGGDGTLEISSAGFSRTLRSRLYQAPALIEVEPAEGIHLGTLRTLQSAGASIDISNLGGVPVTIELTVPPAIAIEGMRRFTLDAGATRTVNFEFNSTRPGAFEGHFELAWNNERKSIPITALVGGEDSPAGLPVQSAEASREAVPPAPGADSSQTPTLPTREVALAFDQIYILNQGHHSVRVGWKMPDPAPASFRVDSRWLTTGPDERVLETWRPLENVLLNREDELMAADLLGLQPGQRLVIRIMCLDAAGQITAVSSAFTIATALPAAGWRIPWNWLLAGCILVGSFLWMRARRRQQLARDLAAIEHMSGS